MKATGMEDNSEAKPLAQIERHSYSEVGWISRQKSSRLQSRENFFLDIPFYRTHQPRVKTAFLWLTCKRGLFTSVIFGMTRGE